jgi:hypothetical protein
MRGTKIEVPDQSDVISQRILKEKKPDVQQIISDLSPCSPKYSLIRVPLCRPMPSDELKSKQQTPLSLFQFFIFSSLFQIMANHINIKASLKRFKETARQRSWHDITGAEIEAFIDILLYVRLTVLLRTQNY